MIKKLLILSILIEVFISGCSNEIKKGGTYNFIDSLNISCNIPKRLINETNNLLEEQGKEIIHGYPCEAISPQCTAETYLFKYNDSILVHRWHYLGSPDDTYYLIFKDKKYHCLKERLKGESSTT